MVTATKTSTYEIYLTILVTVAFLTAALLLISDSPRLAYLSCFFLFLGAFLFLEKGFRPKPKINPRTAPLATFNTKFNVRLKGNVAGSVTVSFQWPDRADNAYVQQRIFVRASAAVAERFSTLTEPPKHAALRAYILDAIKGEVRSLGLHSVEVLIQDIELKDPPQDGGDSGIIVGVSIRS